MRLKINRILLRIFMLGTFCSCSAQKGLQQERCNILNDIFKDKAFKIGRQILPASTVKSRGRVKIDTSIYFDIDTLNTIYIDAPAYWLQKENFGTVASLYSLLTNRDLQFMQEQFENSDNMSSEYFKDCFNSSDVFSKDASKDIVDVVSLPLLSKDKQKSMFFLFNSLDRQTIPNVWICKKENGKWKLAALIEGSLYDTSPSYD